MKQTIKGNNCKAVYICFKIPFSHINKIIFLISLISINNQS